MNNNYLIPANSKKSMLIVGLFTMKDLIVIGIGAALTVVMLIVFRDPKIYQLIIAITPLLIAGTLIFPIAHYHNVMQLLTNIFTYIFRRKKYYWKGWCVKDETIE